MGRVSRGNRAIRWIEQYCRIPEGEFVGQPVKLQKFQKDVIKGIYDTSTRRVIISFGRKNAKTTLSAFLCLLHLVGPEAKANSQLYSAAQSRDQASILFNLMVKVIRLSPDLNGVIAVRESAKQLFCEELGTLYRALSAEASTAYGLSPVFVVHDELGQVVGPRSPLYDALETAAGAQKEPLSVVISTQAPTDADLLSVLIDDAKAGYDKETKLFLYTADESIDPFSEKAIKSANPAYGIFLNKKEVKRQADSASRMPSQEAAYRNLVLNQRISRNTPFVSQRVWKENGLCLRPEDFEGPVTIGLDLSDRHDLTAMIAVGRGTDGSLSVKSNFYLPADGIAEKSIQDRVPYDLWANDGHLTLTPGKSIEFDFVAKTLADWAESTDITVYFDRWGMKMLRPSLLDVGFDEQWIANHFVEHGQGYKDMSPALKTLEIELLNGRIRHGMHPVLTWNAANAVEVKDPAGNKKLDKVKSTGRIDGMVALAMAVGGSAAYEPVGSLDDFLGSYISHESI